MKKIYRFFAIIALLSMSLTAKSQDAIGLTLLPQVPYGNMYNPAIPMSSDIFLGVGISNINLSVYNSSIKYSNIYNYENGTPVSINAVKFINSLDDENFINTDFSLDVLRLGFRIKKLFFNVDCKIRYNGEFHYSRDFLGFFLKGNGNYMGDNYADLSIGVDMSVATELALGVQYQINDKLIVAVRPKVLCGVANVTVNDDGTRVYTDEDTYEMTGDVNLNIKMSSLLDLGVEKVADFASIDFAQLNYQDMLSNVRDNFGFGIDLGASYTFNKHFGVAAGVYDLGFIRWRNTREKHEHKENIMINEALCKDYEDLTNLHLDFNEFVEDMVSIWGDGYLAPSDEYKTSLKTRVMLQGYYELTPMLRISAIGQMYYVNKKIMRPSVTLAYSGSFFKVLNLTTSYTISKYSGNALAAGFALNLGPLKVYAVSDNIMLLSKRSAPVTEMLTSYRVANFRLGLIFSVDYRKN